MSGRNSWARTAPVVVWVAALGGCARGGPGASTARAAGTRNTVIEEEPCPLDGPSVEHVDVNGDGRPDRSRGASAGGRCEELDFNFDGVVDRRVFTDEAGQRRRAESDYDRDGRIDEVVLYVSGVPSEVRRATTLAGRIDTWQRYAGGRLTAIERDANGDAVVDQWWEFPEGRPPQCPLVHSDVDGDGRPDPGATVDLCADGLPDAEDGESEPAAPGAGLPVEVPTGPSVPTEQPAPSEQEADSGGEP